MRVGGGLTGKVSGVEFPSKAASMSSGIERDKRRDLLGGVDLC